jgi:hypothetical protein
MLPSTSQISLLSASKSLAKLSKQEDHHNHAPIEEATPGGGNGSHDEGEIRFNKLTQQNDTIREEENSEDHHRQILERVNS